MSELLGNYTGVFERRIWLKEYGLKSGRRGETKKAMRTMAEMDGEESDMHIRGGPR